MKPLVDLRNGPFHAHDKKIMNRDALYKTESANGNPRLLSLAIVLLGAVFFYVGHDFRISSVEDFAPWSASNGSLQSGGNVAKGIALSLIGLFGIYLLLRRDGKSLRLIGWLPAIMAFYLTWTAASVLWSIDPGLSCRKLAVLIFCVFGALGFARQFRSRDIVLMAMIVPAVFLGLGILAELALGTFRPFSAGYRFSGTVHPNTQGALLATLCMASFCYARLVPRDDLRPRKIIWALFSLGLVFLLLTKSRTSCAAVAVSLATLWLIGLSLRTRLMLILSAGFICCATFLGGIMLGFDVDDAVARAVMLGREDESAKLTGRIPIWNELLGYVADRPLQGFGYEAFWTDEHIEAVSDEVQWHVREAHNAYLDSTLSVGLIGTATLLLIIAMAMFLSAKRYRAIGDASAALAFCLLVFSALNAILETGLAAPNFVTLIAGSGIAMLYTAPEAVRSSTLDVTEGNGF